MSATLAEIGRWTGPADSACFSDESLIRAAGRVRAPAYILRESRDGRIGVGIAGSFTPRDGNGMHGATDGEPVLPCLGILPALYPEWLGDRAFLEAHGLRFPYVAGAMARGIGSEEIVLAMARAGMIGFFGAGGLGLGRVEHALNRFQTELGDAEPWGCNLIHSPQEPELENELVSLLLRLHVRRVSASAFMSLTPAVVRYAFAGVHRTEDGRIERKNHVFAKISRPEVARHFMSPPPQSLLDALVAAGNLTTTEAALARHLPVAEDITVESDSGGHTDNRPLSALFPIIAQLRDELTTTFGYARPIRVGAAGGLGTPDAVAAAFALGAAYVVTGSVNQGCVEAGVSETAKAMLAQAGLADTAMCPSADMFELGVKVQVLKRGTMLPARASTLYALYTKYDSLDAIPVDEIQRLEQQIFRQPLSQVWDGVQEFFTRRNPRELERAARDPKHKMALVFRSYLGLSSKWPIDGDQDRKLDYQLWCGPAMGAFNEWAKGSFLEEPANRTVVQVALNLLEGAAVVTRAGQMRTYGVPVPAGAYRFPPRRLQPNPDAESKR